MSRLNIVLQLSIIIVIIITTITIINMTDRLTQLQICLDQVMEQFCATLNYIDKNHDFEPANKFETKMTDKHATVAPKEEFTNTIDELSTDIILKTRQIIKLIDSLPGVDVSADEQLHKIDSLQKNLIEVEKKKIEAIRKKESLLNEVDSLITTFVSGLTEAAQSKGHGNIYCYNQGPSEDKTEKSGIKLESMHNEVKIEQELSKDDNEVTV